MSLIKTIPAIKEKIQKVMTEHREAKDNIPDFSIFSDDQRTELKQNYINNLNNTTLKKLEDISSDVSIKKSIVSRTANNKKFPLTNSALLSDEKLQIQILKQRAETLALNPNLDYNVLSYLKSELENNNIDYVNYFRDAVKLNTSVSSELKSEMNKVFNDVDNITGFKDLNNEVNLCSAFETKINSYKDIVSDESPDKKIGLIYIDNDIDRLSSELKTDTI